MNLVQEQEAVRQQENNKQPDICHCRTLLEKMANNWSRRAQVVKAKQKVQREHQPEMVFDETKDDFRLDLIPFKDHPDFLAAPVELQKKVLSSGWIAYNEKTVDIEAKVVTPVCNHIIYRELPGIDDGVSQEIASDTLTDEAYHTLLVISACRMTREKRGLESLKLPSFNLVKKMEQEQARHSAPWQKMLIQMATAIVSEVFISDYLDLLSTDTTIQPLNRCMVATHRADEMAHSSIFKNLAKCMYSQLNWEQKKFFAQILPQPVTWFANSELDVWQSILKQLQFPKAGQIIADCAAAEVDLIRIDYSDVTALADELGILKFSKALEGFQEKALLN